MSIQFISLPELKSQAKSLRAALAETGQNVTHSQSLELLARQHGFRDWNTLHAKCGTAAPPAFAVGEKVSGSYLGQKFRGQILGVRVIGDSRYRLTIRFDTAIDVVTFEGMSNVRRQIQAVVNAEGVSAEKTSDGQPHLRLERA